MSSIEEDPSSCFVIGGVKPSTFVVSDEPTWLKVTPDDHELDGFDLAYESARDCEEEQPGFFHNKLAEHVDGTNIRSKAPVVVMSSGRYRYDAEGVPIPGAKLVCSTCKFQKVYDSWAQMEENIPEECGADKINPECHMYHGRMKYQFDKRSGR